MNIKTGMPGKKEMASLSDQFQQLRKTLLETEDLLKSMQPKHTTEISTDTSNSPRARFEGGEVGDEAVKMVMGLRTVDENGRQPFRDDAMLVAAMQKALERMGDSDKEKRYKEYFNRFINGYFQVGERKHIIPLVAMMRCALFLEVSAAENFITGTHIFADQYRNRLRICRELITVVFAAYPEKPTFNAATKDAYVDSTHGMGGKLAADDPNTSTDNGYWEMRQGLIALREWISNVKPVD